MLERFERSDDGCEVSLYALVEPPTVNKATSGKREDDAATAAEPHSPARFLIRIAH